MISTDRFIQGLKRYPPGLSPLSARGCYGRVVRTRLPTPLQLAEEEDRRLVMVMGPGGLGSLTGRSHYEMLLRIGHTREYIAHKLAQGYSYHMAVFTRPGCEMRLATWKNTLALVAKAHPAAAPILFKRAPELIKTSFAQFVQEAGFDPALVDRLGAGDPRFITLDRLLHGSGTALNARLFLYHTVRLTELYSGDGYTHTQDGKRGVREYIMLNSKISDLSGSRTLQLSVTVPAGPL